MTPSARVRASDANLRFLLRPHPTLGFPIPRYEGASVANVASSVAGAVGGVDGGAPELLPPLLPSLDPFSGRSASGPVVVLIIDGLGWFPFRSWARTAPEVGARWAAFSRAITTVFPTTTTAALTSVSSAVAPGTHGLVGYRQYLPRFGVVADLLRMSPVGVTGNDLLVHRGFRPALVSGAPTIFRRGLSAVAISRDRFQDSGFTRVLYDGAAYVPYATGTDLAHELLRVLQRTRPPSVVYAYWDELDTIQHLKGPEEPGLFGLELGRVAGLIDWVGRHLGRRRARETTILATGDHGQVASAIDRQLRVDRWPEVAREMAHPIGGDRRAGFFAAKPGRAGALERALRRRLPSGSRVVSMDEALGAGAFGPGPFHPEISSRLGDWLALVPPPWGMRDLAPGATPPSRHLFGAHGGVDPAELIVPLISAKLSELTGTADR
ncbi:MAG TPA: alkaline phosphatase family protein [Thermoplasmata archaeon]|nr:alkaline phosphatase family protein [Thermoplasmata archaeon]